jgi:predicted phage-related endonuclease
VGVSGGKKLEIADRRQPMTLNEISILAKEYCEKHAMMKQVEKDVEVLKTEITDELSIRDVEMLDTGVYVIKWTPYKITKIDSAALKEGHPHVFAQYVKETVARRFKVTQ